MIGGYITWISPQTITTTCKIDQTWFPFDVQACKIKLGTEKMDLTPQGVGVRSMKKIKTGREIKSVEAPKSETVHGPQA